MQHTSKESNYPIASLSIFIHACLFSFLLLGLLHQRERQGEIQEDNIPESKEFLQKKDDDGLYIRHIGAPVAGRLFERRFISR